MLLRLANERGAKKWFERDACAKRSAQIDLVFAKEAGAKASVSSQTNSVAASTIRVRHRRDHSDAPGRAFESKVSRGAIAPRWRGHRNQLAHLRERSQDLFRRHNMFPRQLAHLTDRH